MMAKKETRPRDVNQLAKYIVDLATGEKEKPTVKKKKASPVKKGR